jgi:hypothetical protein
MRSCCVPTKALSRRDEPQSAGFGRNIRNEILDELLKDYQKPEDLLGQSGLLQQLSKALIERVLDGELTHHLGYEKHSSEAKNSSNSRNGKTRKTLKVCGADLQFIGLGSQPRWARANVYRRPPLSRQGSTRKRPYLRWNTGLLESANLRSAPEDH